MGRLKRNSEELCQQGWEFIEKEDYSAAFSKFDEALGAPYSMGVKAPVTDLFSFEGISLGTAQSRFINACNGAWYCQIRMAEGEDGGEWSHILEAIRFAELRKSVEMSETMQLNREGIGWEATSELLEAEKASLQKLEEIQKKLKTERFFLSTEMDDELPPNITKLFKTKEEILVELYQFKIRVYSEWLSYQDEMEPHSVFEEYDPLDKFYNIIHETDEFHTDQSLSMIYYMIQPDTEELIIICDMLLSGNNTEEYPVKLVRRSLHDYENLNEILKKYNVALDARDCGALEDIISKLDELLLPCLLPNTDFMLLILDQAIAWIPWELLGESKGTSLGLKYCLAKSPSLDQFRINFERRSRLECIQQFSKEIIPSVILFGNPTMDLDNAEIEVDQLMKYLTSRRVKTEVFKHENASVDKFDQINQAVDIIHFACHADFYAEDPMLSNLKLYNGHILLPRMVAEHNFSHFPITILSACDTGRIKAEKGEVLGLVRGFFLAGSSTVIATNWKVDDEMALMQMLRFYEGVLDGKCVGLALRDARKDAYDNAEWRQNPFDWAAYSLYGDPFRSLYGQLSKGPCPFLQ